MAVSQRVLTRLALALLLTSAAPSGAAAAPRSGEPIRSTVVDAETGQPLAGVAVLLDRRFACRRPQGVVVVHPAPFEESSTSADGALAIGAPPARPRCRAWTDRVLLVRPGYLPGTAMPASTTHLPRVRYRLEMRAYADLDTSASTRRAGAPGYERAVALARRVPFAPAGDPGVFASHPGAVFDHVAIVVHGAEGGTGPEPTVLAQDRLTGTLHAWSLRGDARPPVPVPADLALLPGAAPGGFPLLVRDGAFVLAHDSTASLRRLASPVWLRLAPGVGRVRSGAVSGNVFVTLEGGGLDVVVYDDRFDDPRRPRTEAPLRFAGRTSVRDLAGDGATAIACLARHQADPNRPGSVSSRAAFLAVVEVGGHPQVFAIPAPSGSAARSIRATRVEMPRDLLTGPVTACAARAGVLFLAVRDRGLLRLALRPAGDGRRLVVDGHARREVDSPRTFNALAIGPVVPGVPGLAALYATAGDGSVYRFGLDLEPDLRVAVSAD